MINSMFVFVKTYFWAFLKHNIYVYIYIYNIFVLFVSDSVVF